MMKSFLLPILKTSYWAFPLIWMAFALSVIKLIWNIKFKKKLWKIKTTKKWFWFRKGEHRFCKCLWAGILFGGLLPLQLSPETLAVFFRGLWSFTLARAFYFSAGPSGVLPVAKEKRIFRNPSTENRVKNGVYLTFSQKVRFFAIFRIILRFSIMTSIFLSLCNNLFFDFIDFSVKKGLKNENIFWRFRF